MLLADMQSRREPKERIAGYVHSHNEHALLYVERRSEIVARQDGESLRKVPILALTKQSHVNNKTTGCSFLSAMMINNTIYAISELLTLSHVLQRATVHHHDAGLQQTRLCSLVWTFASSSQNINA